MSLIEHRNNKATNSITTDLKREKVPRIGSTSGKAVLAKSIQIITSLIGRAVRSFALAIMILETCWGLLMAGLCFWVASDGSTFRGIAAVVMALVLVTVCAVVIALYFAALAVVRLAMREAGLGQSIFDELFERAIGVTGDDPGESPENAKIPTHLSREEVETVLNDAARSVISDEMPSTLWATPLFWLAKQIQKICVWATVKVVVQSCSNDGNSVNLFELRDRLGSIIDEGVVSFLNQYFTRLSLSIISFASAVAFMLAYGMRYLPF